MKEIDEAIEELESIKVSEEYDGWDNLDTALAALRTIEWVVGLHGTFTFNNKSIIDKFNSFLKGGV